MGIGHNRNSYLVSATKDIGRVELRRKVVDDHTLAVDGVLKSLVGSFAAK